jgi:uroporphyrinogen decarboxylase
MRQLHTTSRPTASIEPVASLEPAASNPSPASIRPAAPIGSAAPRARAQVDVDRETPLLLRAYRGEPVERVPVWFMRQAGRCLPEYRAIRGHADLLEICRTPELAAEATLQPLARLGVDAAILFSDITLPLAAAGVELEIVRGVGPVIAEPIRSTSDLSRLRPFDPDEDAPYVAETVRLVLAETDVPLIGFAGGPFTLASYLIEGGPSKTHSRTRQLMHGEPLLWARLLVRLADIAIASLRSQVAAGARAVQVFESWAGALDPESYRRLVLPAARRVFDALADLGVPMVHFGIGTGELLELLALAGADVVGVDWHVPLDRARARLGREITVQGNLDPALCLAPWPVLRRHVDAVLDRGGGTGHVFNLGHGVLPETSPDTLARIVEHVRERSASRAAREPIRLPTPLRRA